jgi:hypothetical protein
MEESSKTLRSELEHQRELVGKERRIREMLGQSLQPSCVNQQHSGLANNDELILLYEKVTLPHHT